MEKLEHVAVLLFAGSQDGPDAFAPAHAVRSLGDQPIDNTPLGCARGLRHLPRRFAKQSARHIQLQHFVQHLLKAS